METSTNLPSKRSAPELLTTAQAADYLSIKAHTLEIWRCARRYELRFVRIGRNIRYRREDLDSFLTARTVTAEAA
jgi:excisionase family DNA binding protein